MHTLTIRWTLSLLLFLLPLTLFSENDRRFENRNIPQWIKKQVKHEFAAFEGKKITKKNLDVYYDEIPDNAGIYSFLIKDNRVYVKGKCERPNILERSRVVYEFLSQLCNLVEIPNVEFMVALEDACDCQKQKVPLLVFAKKKSCSHQVAIPDFEAMMGYVDLTRRVNEAGGNWPWNSKSEICFWRGATTGGIYNLDNWRSIGRTRLVLLSLDYPELLDCRFTSLCQGAENNPEMNAMPQLLSGSVSPEASLQYKYLVDIDGNTCGYQRLYWTLLSNSVVFKQMTENYQWYYSALKPFVHYIPVAEDMSDLVEQILWAKENDNLARWIAGNATEFANTHLRLSDSQQYVYWVLKKYSKLQGFKPVLDKNEYRSY